MTILAAPSPAGTLTASPVPLAPPRLNFAGFCGYCGGHDCSDVMCVARYVSSWWAVCPSCGGSGDAGGTGCDFCLYGVIEVHASHPGAVAPR